MDTFRVWILVLSLTSALSVGASMTSSSKAAESGWLWMTIIYNVVAILIAIFGLN